MSGLSRRDFVFASSGAVAGNFITPGLAEADDDDHAHGIDFSHSGLVTGKPKPLKHKAIPGFLSAEQIAPHHTAHYGGALRGYSGADARLEASIKSGEAIDGAAYGALKRAVNSKGNSVVLLIVVVPLRKVVLDSNGPVLAAVLGAVGLLAIAMGLLIIPTTGKRAWEVHPAFGEESGRQIRTS